MFPGRPVRSTSAAQPSYVLAGLGGAESELGKGGKYVEGDVS